MLKGISHLVNRAVRQSFIEPNLRRRYTRRTGPFIHRSRDGLVFALEPGECVDGVIAVEGIYERRFLKYIKSILPDNAIMLDIGANIGNHSLYLASRCNQIHCFEPNPQVAKRLRWNITANSFADRITVHQYGLGDEDATLTFHENVQGNLGASAFTQSNDVPQGYRALTLHVKHAERAVQALDLARIDFIKVDVEGMEEAVITALKPIIDQFQPIVSFEHHEQLAKPNTFQRIRDSLEGYRLMEPCFAPDGTAWGKLVWNILHDGGPLLTEVVVPEHRTYENVIALPA